MENSICSIIRKLESEFNSGPREKSEYVSFDMKGDLDTIDAYLNSKHISGPTDDMGREKPFFNIVTAVRNIWFRATDIDRKNIRIKASKAANHLVAFLASIHLKNWMKKTAFGIFLNDWGLALASYGSAILKFVEKDNELYPEVIPWSRILVDPIDFENNPVVEKLYFTPAQLKQNENYDQEMVDQLIDSAKDSRRNWGGQPKDHKSDYILVYELHGKLSQAKYKESKGLEVLEGDDKIFYDQIHVVSFTGSKSSKYNDFVLYCGKEKQSPYMITHLIEEEGQTLSNGAVKYLFEAQWMINHSVKLIKDQLDLASKIIFQTSDPSFIGRNVLTNIENGDILTYQINQPLTQLNNKPDIVAMQAYGNQWRELSRELSSTPEAVRGENMPSGTPYSLAAYLGNQASSLFEQMTEHKGLYIEEMMRRFILPHLSKKMDTTDEIVATLEEYEITQIDSAFVPKEVIRLANKQIKQDIVNGKFSQSPDLGAIESQIRGKLSEFGNKRYIRPSELESTKWSDIFSDFVWEAEVEVTNEQSDKQAILQTLSTVLQNVATNPAVLQDPNMRLLFNKILDISGAVDPIELTQVAAPSQNMSMEQTTQPAVGGSRVAQNLLTQ